MDNKSEPIVVMDPEKASPGSEDNSVDHQAGVEQASIPRSITGFKWFLLLIAILSSAFLFALDNSIVADIQPKIIERFGHIDKLPWLSVAFALGGSSTTLVWAAFYSRFDAKYNYLTALFLFEVGSAICGSAPQIDVLIWGRVLAGLGGAGLYVGVLTLLSSLTTPQERPIFIASIGLIWGGGSVLGPVIGGAFADSSATWRWAFYINLVVAGIFLPVYLLIIPNVDPQPLRKISDRFRSLDYCGIFLILAILSLGTIGLAFGGSLLPWNSPTVIATLVVSGVLLICFIFQQAYCIFTTREDRILPIHYFRRRTLTLMFVVSFISGGPIFIPVYFIPLFFQFTRGDSAIQAAVRLLPFIFMLVFFSLLSGAVMGTTGLYMPWFLFGSVLIIIGSALMFTVDEMTSTSKVYGYSVVLAIGAGSILQLGFIVAQAVVSRSEMSQAVAFINLAQIGGLDVALTVANTVFLNVAIKQVSLVLPLADPATVKSAISGTGTAFVRSLAPDVQLMVFKAVVYSISRTYIFCIAAGALMIILSAGMRWEKVFLVL